MDGLDSLLAQVEAFPADRDERAAWVTARGEELADALGAAMVALLDPVLAAAADQVVTAALDPATLDPLAEVWRSFVVEVAGEYTAGMYLAGNLSVWISVPGDGPQPEDAAGWAAQVNRNAVEYQATATNRIVGASADLWTDVQAKTVTRLQDGVTIPELRRDVEGITGYAKGRAQAIARTETLAAYSGGEMDGARALGEFGPTHKRWLAADDSRTRPTHVGADGQLQRIGDPFDVGGVTMDRPLDPAAPAAEVVNCRCTTQLLWEDDLSDAELRSLTAAAGPSGVVIVALPEGDEKITYNDGDEAPLHQTLVYLGTTDELEAGDGDAVVAMTELLAAEFEPFDATVIGRAELGADADEVVLTESAELQALHDAALGDEVVRSMHAARNAHPTWVSHVTENGSGRAFGDVIRFDRVAAWIGSERVEFPLS